MEIHPAWRNLLAPVRVAVRVALAIAVVFLAACSSAGSHVAEPSDHKLFPRSQDILRQPEFSMLAYSKSPLEEEDAPDKNIAYEVWGDERFIANSTITLRYTYIYDPAVLQWQRIYRPVALGLDTAYPTAAAHFRAAKALVRVMEANWRISMEPIIAAMRRQGGTDVPVTEVIELDRAIAEITLKSIPQRGRFVSLDFYEKDFYRRFRQ